MWLVLLLIVAILRLVAPLAIFLYPIATTILSSILDSLDGYLAYRARFTYQQYHMYDKLADYWWYIFILLYSVDLPIFPVIFILFVYRTVGQIVSLTLYNRAVLLFFPAVLELFFIAYLTTTIFPALSPIMEFKLMPLTLAACLALSVVREYVINVKQISTLHLLLGVHFDWSENKPK